MSGALNQARASACTRAVTRLYQATGAPTTTMAICDELGWPWSPASLGALTALNSGQLEWRDGFVPVAAARQPIDAARRAWRVEDLARRVQEAGGRMPAEELARCLGWPECFDEAVGHAVEAGAIEVVCEGDEIMLVARDVARRAAA